MNCGWRNNWIHLFNRKNNSNTEAKYYIDSEKADTAVSDEC